MYTFDVRDVEWIIRYKEVFSGEKPDLKEEIENLNMHKAISIICELIGIRDVILKSIFVSCGNRSEKFTITVEHELKRICGIVPKSSDDIESNRLLSNKLHIISIQMLLLLLKKIIHYGNYATMNDTEYQIVEDDYKKIIQLQLLVADDIYYKHLKELDINHCIYSNYHLNYKRNMAHEFQRMYYMMEKVCREPKNFDEDVQREYKNYYSDFTNKYNMTPTDYSSFLFGELTVYYNDINALTSNTMWRNVKKVYGKLGVEEEVSKVLKILSKPLEYYKGWAEKSEDQEWDFSKFFEFPFIIDNNENYISISDITLRNAFFEKLFWLIRNCYPNTNNEAMAFFGRIFEKYIQDLTKDAVTGDYTYINEFILKNKNEKKSSDAYIRKENNLLVVEVKGFSVYLDCMIKNEKIEDNNDKLFVKPILQADTFLNIIGEEEIEFKGIEDAYIISVTMDNINAVPNYYDRIHEEIIKKKQCEKSKYFFNFNVEEYEMLMYLVEKGYDIFDLLKNYYEKLMLKPFGTYVQEIYPNIGMTAFMEKHYQEASDDMKKRYFDNLNDNV